MNTDEAIRTIRAVRKFADRSVPDETIHAIVNAGRRAQSSKNTQPWHFVIVRQPEMLTKLGALGPFAKHLAGAAFAVTLLSPDPTGRWSISFDLGQATAYMQLEAWERGVGSCIAAVYEPDKARELLGFPADLHCVVMLSFGYPAEDQSQKPLRKGGRKPLAEVVHWETW